MHIRHSANAMHICHTPQLCHLVFYWDFLFLSRVGWLDAFTDGVGGAFLWVSAMYKMDPLYHIARAWVCESIPLPPLIKSI